MNFATIVLREAPEPHIHLDLQTIPTSAPFRGVSLVPPGLHVIRTAEHTHWFWTEPGEVAVFTPTLKPETGLRKATAARLAMRSGFAMYDLATHDTWYVLTNAITPRTPNTTPNPFEPVLSVTHADAFLAGFQMAFIQWHLTADAIAFRRWVAHLALIYKAEPQLMAASPWLFSRLAASFYVQCEQLPDAILLHTQPIVKGAQRFALRLIQSNIADLIDRGSRLRLYIAQRQTRAS